jgi:hypothetical protein
MAVNAHSLPLASADFLLGLRFGPTKFLRNFWLSQNYMALQPRRRYSSKLNPIESEFRNPINEYLKCRQYVNGWLVRFIPVVPTWSIGQS